MGKVNVALMLFFGMCVQVTMGAPSAERVESLPDYGTPPAPQYSGFLQAVCE